MRAAQATSLPSFQATVAGPTLDHVRALEAALVSARAAEERFRGLVESIDAVPYISAWDAHGTIRYMSPHVEELLGYPREQWYHGPDPWSANLHPDDRERVLAESERTFTHGTDFNCEYRMHTADGRVVWIAERETIVRDEAGTPLFCHGVMFDITRLKTAEQRLVAAESALREERDLAQRYLDVARTMLLVLDADETVRLLNQHGHEVLGHPAGSLIGANWFDVAVPADEREAIREIFRGAMDGAPSPSARGRRTPLVTAAGEVRTMAWRHTSCTTPTAARPARCPRARTSRSSCAPRPRSAGSRSTTTSRACRTARTSTPSCAPRSRPRRPPGTPSACSSPTSTASSASTTRTGTRRATSCCAPWPGGSPGSRAPGSLGRHGGDEFLVLLDALPLDPVAAAAAAAAIAAAIAERLDAPFALAGTSVRIQASVGCSLYPFDAADAEALLQHADAAMYRAKRRATPAGGGSLAVFAARSLRALLADVGPARREEIAGVLAAAGWTVHAESVAGTDALSAALARRGWDVVIYGGEGEDRVPARKAMALVRMADPELAFVAAVASVRPGDLSAFVQGFGPDAIFAPDPARLPEVLEPVLRARAEARPDTDGAHRLLLAQQAITDHVAAGLAPDELCARVLEVLGQALGWTYGAVWRPDGESSMLRCTALWHDPAADPQVAAFADVSRRLKIAPGRGLPGRAYAFRRPAWIADVGADGNMPRHGHALRAGPDHRGRLPDRARRRLRRRDRVLLGGHPRARRPGRRDVRHRRRPARPVPGAAPAAGRREPPRRGHAARRARPRPALPRRRRDDDRRPRRRGADPAHQQEGLRRPGPRRGGAARRELVRDRHPRRTSASRSATATPS